MAVLITGSRGFVGSHLTPFLRENGCEIILFDGDVSSKKETDNFKTDKKIEAVIHLAAAQNKKGKLIFNKVNVLGTKNIVDLCCRLNAGRLIFLSSIKTLSFLTNPYIDSKKEAEKIIINSGAPYIILRPSMIYGPGDRNNLGFLIKLAKLLPLMPVFDFKIQPLYVKDLVKIIIACLRFPPNKIFNITGPEIISSRDILKELKSLNYKFSEIYLPGFFSVIIKLCAFFPFSPLTSWQIESLLSNELFESSEWEKLFNLKATPFKEGIYKTAKL